MSDEKGRGMGIWNIERLVFRFSGFGFKLI